MSGNNEIRFIVTGDLHWTGRSPKSRKDDYREVLIEKLVDINNIIVDYYDHSISGIIIPGDIFDSPGVSLSVIGELMSILSSFSVPIYTIAGNHDLYSGNPESIHRTPYGILKTSGLIRCIHHHKKIFNLNSKNIMLIGKSYQSGFTDAVDGMNAYYMYTDHGADTNILVTHGMLLERSPGYELRHTLLREVAERHNAPDVLINGHEHNGFGIKKVNNTLFINPGSIGRIKATEENLNRQPQVALLTIPADGEPHAELIKLESAASGPKVLSRKHIKEQKRKKEMTKEFLGLLAEEGQSNYMELEDILSNIAERESLPESIVKEALERLEKEREAMDHEQRTG